MTGRELIIYMLENNLENASLLTVEQAAAQWECGPATVKALINIQRVKGVKIGDAYFVFVTDSNPFEKNQKELK